LQLCRDPLSELCSERATIINSTYAGAEIVVQAVSNVLGGECMNHHLETDPKAGLFNHAGHIMWVNDLDD